MKVIVAERKRAGAFKDLFDLCRRLPAKIATQPILEALILAGACDEWDKTRSTLLATIDSALNLADLSRKGDSPVDLFDEIGGSTLALKPKYTEMPEMPAIDRLTQEKDYLGMYLSKHPLTSYPHQLKRAHVQQLQTVKLEQTANFGVYVHQLKETRTKKGELMCFITVSDPSTERSGVVFPQAYRAMKGVLVENKAVILNGKMSERQGKQQLVVNSMTLLEEDDAPFAPAQRLYVNCESTQIIALKEILATEPGTVEVIVVDKATRRGIALNNSFNIVMTESLAKALDTLLSPSGWVMK